jgi:hypothetical protein
MKFHTLRPEDIVNGRLHANRLEMIKTMSSIGRYAEIGVAFGHLTQFVLETLKPSEVHLFDIFTVHQFDYFMGGNKTSDYFQGGTHKQYIEKKFANEIQAGRVILHEGDSSSNMHRLPDAYFDCIYIDGDHTYDGVKKDLAAAITKIKPDGRLIFNDYVLWCEDGELGIVPVVNDLCALGEWCITDFALHSAMYCDIALRRRQFS